MSLYCVALDPGGTTGVATIPEESDPWKIVPAEMEGDHHLRLFDYLLTGQPHYVVCESFLHTQNEAARLTSAEIIGVVKAYLQESGAEGVWQAPATGKAFWTDEKLKQHGLYVAGLRHARDAIRHYAYWRTFTLKDQTILTRSGSVTRPARPERPRKSSPHTPPEP